MADFPKTLPYSTLEQTHPHYSRALYDELETLYEGGYEAAKHAHRYLPQLAVETERRYHERLKGAAYIGYLGQIVNYFSSALFKQPIAVTPDGDGDGGDFDEDFYTDFANDVDLAGASLVEFMRSVLTTALLHKRTLIACDFPRNVSQPVSRKDEDAVGANRAYLVKLNPDQLIDWAYDECVEQHTEIPGGVVKFSVGTFKWCVLHRHSYPRNGIAGSRNVRVCEWKVWQRDPETGMAQWGLYRYEARLDEKIPNEKEIPLVDSGDTSFDRIPIVELYIPNGLWIGNIVGPLNKEHWQRRSILNQSENSGLLGIPYVKLGPEIGEGIPAEVQQDPGRGESLREQMSARGYAVFGKDDDIGFAEPEGKAQLNAETRIGKLTDEMYRVVSMMASSVSSTSNAVGRSGASKAEDRGSTTIVLFAIGAIVRDCVRRVYETVTAGRSERATWIVRGLDKYDNYDRAEILEEAVSVDEVGINSPTFKKVYKTSLASRLVPDAPPEIAAKIEEEIEASVDQEVKDAEEAKKAAAELAKNPPAVPPVQPLPGQPPAMPAPQKQQTAPRPPLAKAGQPTKPNGGA